MKDSNKKDKEPLFLPIYMSIGISVGVVIGAATGNIPMCGIPFHSATSYISRLIEKGYKVAVCEQVEDPKTAKGIVKREVVKIVTPGTVVETEILLENEIEILITLDSGDAVATAWGCDLTYDYVKINGDYRT